MVAMYMPHFPSFDAKLDTTKAMVMHGHARSAEKFPLHLFTVSLISISISHSLSSLEVSQQSPVPK
jgi:hypothetical protein